MLENAAPYLIDVRTPAEYAEGHIPGAVNIPLRTLADNLDQIPSDENVVVYCASGHRAGMATSTLRSLGYDNVKAFPGGWKAWSEAENVVEHRSHRTRHVRDRRCQPRNGCRRRRVPEQHPRRLLRRGRH